MKSGRYNISHRVGQGVISAPLIKVKERENENMGNMGMRSRILGIG